MDGVKSSIFSSFYPFVLCMHGGEMFPLSRPLTLLAPAATLCAGEVSGARGNVWVGLFIVIDSIWMIYILQDGHRDEAQAGRGPVWWRVRGHLEEVQRHHRRQDTQGKSS